ncbi:MAG: IS1 family transposase [Clostridium sp.]
MLCIIIYTFEKITCLRCFSTDIYKFVKNNFGIQKYQCKHCKQQFILEKPISKSKGYPKCPICQKATYI